MTRKASDRHDDRAAATEDPGSRTARPDAGAGSGRDEVPLGRRERKKQQTLQRISAVGEALFTEKGYAAVTTQEIAEAADIGAGTLFRYVANKAELLLLVMNERLRLGAERGMMIAERGGEPAAAILGLVEPLMQAALSQPENTAVYHREVLFGADGPYRSEAIRLIRELRDAMATVLHRYAQRHPIREGADTSRVAETVFSVLYLRLVRLELGSVDVRTVTELLRDDVDYLLRELLTPVADRPSDEVRGGK